MTEEFEVAMARVMTSDGIDLQLVDVAICRAPTKRRPPPAQVLDEMRAAAAQGRR